MSYPTGIALDSADTLYVADCGNNRIQVLKDGTWSTIEDTNVPALDCPTGLAVGSDDALYVTVPVGLAPKNHRIFKWTAAGGWSDYVIVDSTVPDVTDPWHIAVHEGTLYVADYGGKVIKKWTVAGGWSTVVDSASSTGGLGGPYGVAVDGAGAVYVGDATAGVLKLAAGGTWSTIGTTGAAGNGFSAPRGVAVGKDGSVYVGDYGAKTIHRGFTIIGDATTPG